MHLLCMSICISGYASIYLDIHLFCRSACLLFCLSARSSGNASGNASGNLVVLLCCKLCICSSAGSGNLAIWLRIHLHLLASVCHSVLPFCSAGRASVACTSGRLLA